MDNKIGKLEDLKIWQESLKLTTEIYRLLKDCRDFGLKMSHPEFYVSK